MYWELTGSWKMVVRIKMGQCICLRSWVGNVSRKLKSFWWKICFFGITCINEFCTVCVLINIKVTFDFMLTFKGRKSKTNMPSLLMESLLYPRIFIWVKRGKKKCVSSLLVTSVTDNVPTVMPHYRKQALFLIL